MNGGDCGPGHCEGVFAVPGAGFSLPALLALVTHRGDGHQSGRDTLVAPGYCPPRDQLVGHLEGQSWRGRGSRAWAWVTPAAGHVGLRQESRWGAWRRGARPALPVLRDAARAL